MNTLFVGIDVSTKHNQSCAINFDQHIFFNKSFINSPDGSKALVETIVSLIDKHHFDKVISVAESTSVYDFHICAYLLSELASINVDALVYSVNARTIAKYKASYIDVEKNDPSDAFICADFARVGRTGRLIPFRGNQYMALRRLTRERVHLSQNLSREKNYCLNNVYLKMSGLLSLPAKDRPFCDNFSATNIEFLTEFRSPYDFCDLSLNEMADFLSKASRNRLDDYQKSADLLKKAVNASYKLDKSSYDLITIAISASINVIRCLESQIKALDKAIEKEMRGLYSNEYQILMSITGIGPVFAAGILAEIGDVSYFPSEAKLARYAGLFWKENQSGDFRAEDKRSSSSCNNYLKYYITQATQMSVYYGFDFTTPYFWDKYNETKTHKQKRALVLTSRKMIRLIYALLRDNKLYSPVSTDTGK